MTTKTAEFHGGSISRRLLKLHQAENLLENDPGTFLSIILNLYIQKLSGDPEHERRFKLLGVSSREIFEAVNDHNDEVDDDLLWAMGEMRRRSMALRG